MNPSKKKAIGGALICMVAVAIGVLVAYPEMGGSWTAGMADGQRLIAARFWRWDDAPVDAAEVSHAGNQPDETLAHVVSDQKLSDRDKAQKLWQLYLALRGDRAGLVFLDTLTLVPWASKSELKDLYAAELRRTDTLTEAKRSLIRLLSEQYVAATASAPVDAKQQQVNDAVTAELRNVIGSGDVRVAGDAVIAYSRLGYFDDSIALLNTARQTGALRGEDYVRETASLLPLVPDAKIQSQIVDAMLSNPDVETAAAVGLLTATMRQPGYIETLNPETASLLAAKLKAAEPQFGPVTNSIDMIDVFRYVDWMSARYALEQKSAQTASSPEDFYARIAIDAGKTDARVLVAILASEVGDQTVAGLKRTGALPAAEQVLLQYAAGTNLNVSTKELVATGQSRINAQRGAP